MKVHITNMYGMPEDSAVALAQGLIVDTGKQMGFAEIGIPRYLINKDKPEELEHLLNGMFAGFEDDDTLFLQTPTWNELEFEIALLDKVDEYKNAKIIIFIHDIIALMFKSNRYILPRLIEEYNRADVIILPSDNMRKFLIRSGLRVSKIVVQGIWDHIYNFPTKEKPRFKRQISFIGNPEKFEFANSWDYNDIRLRVYAGPLKRPNLNVDNVGYLPDIVLVTDLLMNGGFGLVWADDLYWSEYMHVNTSHKIGTYLTAGLPVIIDENNSKAALIRKNGLGFVVGSLDEAVDLVRNISESEYECLRNNVKEFAYLLREGMFAKRLVTEAVFKLLQEDGNADKLNAPIKVLDDQQTLDYIIKNKASISRIGEGEVKLINGDGIVYQDYSPELSTRLRNILAAESTPNFILGIPNIFNGLEMFNTFAQNFWKANLERWQEFYNQMLTANWYGSAFISRPYIDLKDKSSSKDYFHKLKKMWEDQDILIVEGKNSRSGVGNDLFDKAKSVKRIIVPARNAFDKLNEIESQVKKYGKDKLVLLMLGPTAKVVAYDLSKQGFWLVDLGHIDSEYEWFKMGADTKVKINGKHTAEFNYDDDIHLEPNSEYDQQVIIDLSETENE